MACVYQTPDGQKAAVATRGNASSFFLLETHSLILPPDLLSCSAKFQPLPKCQNRALEPNSRKRRRITQCQLDHDRRLERPRRASKTEDVSPLRTGTRRLSVEGVNILRRPSVLAFSQQAESCEFGPCALCVSATLASSMP